VQVRLKDQVAVVTGGARGIGEGIAQCLAEEGARVALLDIDGEAAERAAEELAAGALGLASDVSDETQAAAAAEQVAAHFGRLDILVNNAGGGNRTAAKAAGNPFTRVQ
jgi:NAD(P)-dependent dehydrogenase (short-subunit alcohol dehydrogenase family)